MLRKLILLAIAGSVAKKLYGRREARTSSAPFPTSSRPPEGWRG